jgi:hypothetical protein
MTLPDASAYGRCPCGGVYEPRKVQVNMTNRAEEVHLPDVAQGCCPRCGSRIYKAVVLELLEALSLDRPVPAPRMIPGS